MINTDFISVEFSLKMSRPATIIQKSEQKNLQLFFREIRRVKQDNKEDNYHQVFFP